MPGILDIPDEAECYLWAILSDPSGLDQAEFCITDEATKNKEGKKDGCFRAWPFQWAWWRNDDARQIEQGSRSSGKSLSIRFRALAFPFIHAGQEMVITAPEGNHLDALTDNIETAYLNNRLPAEMLVRGRNGIKHRPFHMNFANGARIMGRIPQRDGRGVKGIHPVWLELDEGQDYPEAGWLEIIETLKEGSDEARWRAHGVTRGVRDKFYEYTQPENGWTVHHYPAMYRPNWSDEERDRKIQLYGHRDSPDFRRNVYGLHGDASSPLFVLHRLMECVDDDRSSDYNVNEYYSRTIDEALIRERDGDVLGLMLDMPNHKLKYKNFWIGMDVGYTVAPSAIVVFAEEKTNKNAPTKLKVIARLTLKRVGHREQVAVILWLVDHFMPQAFAMDRTGLGLPLFQDVQEYVRNNPGTNHILNRIRGYNFSEKVPVEFDDTIKVDENDPKGYEAALIKRNVLEYSSDVLRGLVDSADLILPWDQDLIGEFRGQTWTYDKATLDMYGRKKTYSQGSFHSLDACRMAVLAWKQATMEEFLRNQDEDDIPPETVFLY